ncbi:hypothetical protein GCM10011509_19810 [Ornithinimicrobium pekingense]|uniref:Restriction endonuclease domain-containing protein n=1 Tax=Ornithinimicrobium pekingense TaxID=384677 RepID=A0ABQ2F9C2_9MICO|nr:hypothetical protein GCM10011509_19810 [Ornithinimicrobium pekingense]
MTKLGILERARCPHYWVVDPDDLSLRAWHLVDDRYVLHTRVAGDQEVRLTAPLDVAFRVADLVPADQD